MIWRFICGLLISIECSKCKTCTGSGHDYAHGRSIIDSPHDVAGPKAIVGCQHSNLRATNFQVLAWWKQPPANVSNGYSYIFHQHSALVTTPVPMTNCGHQAPRVHLKERIRLLIRINFDILVRYPLNLERNPDSLDKGAINQQRVNLTVTPPKCTARESRFILE